MPDEIREVSSRYCSECGRDLSGVEGELDYVSQEIDLPQIQPIYRERRFYKKVCSFGCCNRDYAPRRRGGNAIVFGKNIRAIATCLSVVQCMPYERLQSLFETMFNVRISQGTLAYIVREMLEKSRPAIALIERMIKASAVVGFDESGCYTNGKLNWSWIAQTTYLTLVFRGADRGAKVLVDGDGYLDIVESDSENELKVTRSAIGRTNMLKSVTNSIGGRFEVDYAHSTPTYGHPGGKWVMSALTIDDGIHDDGPLMKSAFEYSDGFRDRHERDFLGFGKVVTKSLDTNSGNSVYRQSVQEFAVDNYYASGNLVAYYVTDASGNKFTETVNEYDAYSVTANKDSYSFVQKDVIYSDRASAFVPLRYTANKQYEGTSDGMVVSEACNEYYLNGYHGELKSYRYSDKGNLGSNGAGGYDYATNIQYTSNDGKHIFGLPTNVTVVGGDGSMYHNVSATYDTKYPNHLTQVSQQLGSGVAVTDYKYDRYGNITQKTLPANGTGQRMWYKYRYEPEMNMYVERIDDAWGYRSEAGNFDYRYGIALERRDLNNFYYETEIDNMGRVTKVRGPNELATGVDYIIAFEYKPKAEFGESGISAPAYAVTKHYDIQHPGDDLETVTFVDGFGRPVQVKKDGVVTTASKGSGASDQNVMIVSGRNVYDAFGRVAKAYYPTTEGMGSKTSFNTAFDNVTPTLTAYDVLDRALEVTLPDGSETVTEYSLDSSSKALVTKVTDALGNSQSTFTNGSGKTIKSVQHSGPEGDITTSFEYDGIQRLISVTDTEGNVTTSVYDMGDRRTEVNHPASGITSFTYDPLGNVLTKQTANMAEEGKMITYTYDYHRLTGISYPDHPENNVKYYYGGRNASYNRIGRLMMREDGTGAIEYFYGKMGEVTKTRRTLIVPNQAIATYVTQWTYDSHNRLIEMIYPDEEKVTYSYNLGGLLEKVRGEKSYGYDYITKLGYDKFEQRSYLKYCNGAETFYTYDNRRRLSNLAVNSGGASIMDNAYTFDAVSNVLSVANNASLPANGNAGGQMSHTYTYDGLYRLATATGTYTGADNKSASYTLAMGYDNMHRIKSKSQHLTQDNVQFNGTLNVGYDLTYTYGSEAGKKFQLESVKDVNYRTEETPEGQQIENGHGYTYDKNGNLVYVNTSRMMTDGHRDNSVGERKLIWDEENRLLAVDDNGFVSNYWYDADGERTVKTSGESNQVYVNGVFSGGSTNTAKFSLYVSPYLVANQGGRYTKHIYAGSQRIVSKVGDFASYGSDPRRIEYAGANTDGLSVDYKSKYAAQQQVIKDNYKFFDVPYNGTDNDNYADGEGFCCNDGSMEAAVAEARKAQTARFRGRSKTPTTTRTCSSSIIPTTLAAPASSPTLTVKLSSISSMSPSAKSSSRSVTTCGIRLTSSTRKSLTRRLVCTTMEPVTTSRASACGFPQIQCKKRLRGVLLMHIAQINLLLRQIQMGIGHS